MLSFDINQFYEVYHLPEFQVRSSHRAGLDWGRRTLSRSLLERFYGEAGLTSRHILLQTNEKANAK